MKRPWIAAALIGAVGLSSFGLTVLIAGRARSSASPPNAQPFVLNDVYWNSREEFIASGARCPVEAPPPNEQSAIEKQLRYSARKRAEAAGGRSVSALRAPVRSPSASICTLLKTCPAQAT